MEFLIFIISYGVVFFIGANIWNNIMKKKNIFNFNMKLSKFKKEVAEFIISIVVITVLMYLLENVFVVAIISAVINSLVINVLKKNMDYAGE